MAEPLRQSNRLPSLSYLDLEKIKKETSAYAHNAPMSASLNMSAPPLASPSIYSGPPPPYSYPSSAASSVIGISSGNNGYISPPDTRQASDQEKDSAPPSRIQSLPSIHEALRDEQHTISIQSLLSKSAAITQQARPSSRRSPTSPVSQPTPDTSKPPPSQPHPPPPTNYRSQESLEQPRPRYSPQLPKDIGSAPRFQPPSTYQYPPPQQSRTASSPVAQNKSMPQAMPPQQHTSPTSYDYPRPSATSNNYTYSPYHPSYPYPMQPPSVPAYQPPQPQPPATWRSMGADFERAEEARKTASKGSPVAPSFGETVKRHLERFDLETSLNEIADGSGRALTFSREYGDKAHHTQRAGLTAESMPTLAECDDMIKRQRGVLASMERIREVILKQQADLAEQRNRTQGYKAPSDYDEESSYGDKFDGFAGSDAKKRKGRAAPPGRCHSCNRAETPEWRRGPDGARTLCNACGLHYAKLTRKMGNKSSTSGSNLRPKESSPGLA